MINEDFRRAAPAPLAPKTFNVPEPVETELSNGLRVVVFEDRRLPLISFRLAFRAGETNDPADAPGLTAAMASLLTQGTETRTSRELAEDVEKLGASLGVRSSSDNTIVSASALSLYASDILNLMAELILKPSFPENELALYKENTIKSLEFQRSQADFLAEERVAKIIFGEHPYSRTAPAPEDVEKITRERLIEFQRRSLVPNNAVFIAVGDIDREQFLKELETAFSGWEKGSVNRNSFPAPPEITERTLTVVDRPGSAQSNIVLANLAINRNHPDYFPAIVMNQILGAGASSRIFMNLREEKGYTYGAYSSFDMRRESGAFEATAEVRTPVTGESLKEFFYELERIRNEQVSADELGDAQNFLTGVFPIRAETQEGLTNLIVAQQLYDLPADYLQTYREKISAVLPEDVQRAAQNYVHPDKIAIVIVGDAEEILKQSGSYASKIEVFDTQGAPLDAAAYGKDSAAAPPVDVSGKWNLTLEVMGQSVSVSLVLQQDDEKISGSLDTMFGAGTIESGTVRGNKIQATAKTKMQGQALELNINGAINGGQIKGSIEASMPGFPPVEFTGSKAE